MALLEGKKIVITGVLTDASLAFGVAKIALEEGAEIVLTDGNRVEARRWKTIRDNRGFTEQAIPERVYTDTRAGNHADTSDRDPSALH